MIWSQAEDGIWSASAEGLKFELIPGGEDLVFDLAHMKSTCDHIARMQAHGIGGWANGCLVRMVYRSTGSGAQAIKKTKGGYQRGAKDAN